LDAFRLGVEDRPQEILALAQRLLGVLAIADVGHRADVPHEAFGAFPLGSRLADHPAHGPVGALEPVLRAEHAPLGERLRELPAYALPVERMDGVDEAATERVALRPTADHLPLLVDLKTGARG